MRLAPFALLLTACASRPTSVARVAPVPVPPAPAPIVPARRERVALAPVTAGQGPIGTYHPGRQWMTDPAGRWVVLCQPRNVPRDPYAIGARAAHHVFVRDFGPERPYLIVQGG